MKKINNKYILICLPFVSGSLLFSFGIYNFFSSMLFFGGGYVILKKICNDKIKKINNIDKKTVPEINCSYKKDYSYRSAGNAVLYKRVKRNLRVRKRVK